MTFHFVSGLTLNNDGVLISTNNKSDNEVHLRQGDMDGACGPYCVAMALLILGRMQRNEISPGKNIDFRTKFGRFLKEVNKHAPLVLEGAYPNALRNMIKTYNSSQPDAIEDSGKKLFPRIYRALDDNHPVILDVRSNKDVGLNHWTLAIGYNENFLFLLDPGYELNRSNFWNATLTTKAAGKQFPYRYANNWNCLDVKITTVIEVQ